VKLCLIYKKVVPWSNRIINTNTNASITNKDKNSDTLMRKYVLKGEKPNSYGYIGGCAFDSFYWQLRDELFDNLNDSKATWKSRFVIYRPIWEFFFK
jgi:hypothetical protein